MAIALVSGGGCSDSADSSDTATTALEPGSRGGTGTVSELVELLPEDADQVAWVDVAAVRRALGLRDDQGLGEPDAPSDELVQQLTAALGAAAPFVNLPTAPPILEALDTGAVTAVASVPSGFAPDRAAVVVKTSQPFDDLAAALEEEGYERDGDLLVTDERPAETGGVTVVTAAGDSLIVLAQSEEVAQTVAAGEGDGPALAEKLDAVEGPVRVASARSVDSDSCVETVAAGSQVDPAEGTIVVTVAEPDDADGLELLPGDSELTRSVDLDPAQVDGRTVTTRYRISGYGAFSSPVAFVTAIGAGDGLFTCP